MKNILMEKNYFDAAAAKRAATLIKDIGTCFFITQYSGRARPMTTGKFDEKGAIWFLTDIQSDKVKDILQDTEVRLLYADPRKNKYLDIQGEAELITDRSRIREFWNPLISIWFPDGVEDPDICLLRIKPFSACYWDAVAGRMMQAIKLSSIITGENLVEGKEGAIS